MTENKHVLVVEDEGIIAMHIANTLTSYGYKVSQASSAEEAVKMAGDERPALALLDIMLAGSKDGVWTAEELWKRFGIPFIYLTGHADERTVERAKATRPYAYVLKPFHERQLAATVELAILRHQRETVSASASSVEDGGAGLPPSGQLRTAAGTESSTDPVTGLPSRSEAEILLAESRRRGRSIFVAPFRISRFDFMNEHFGKSLAEAVLQYFGVYLSQEIARGDQLFRWSGPCFVIVMQDRTSLQDAFKSVARFASVRLEQFFDVQDRSAVLVISAAWTVIPVSPSEAGDDVVKKIDEFLLARSD
ncbi:MAG: response regulator [Bryobacteraceae bacterium]